MPVVSIPVEVDIRNCDGIDLLRSLQDNSVDLILADPPYGISKDSGMNKLHERKKAGEELTPTEKKFETATKYGKWDEDFTLEDLERFVELYYKKLKPGGTCIIWFDWVKISFLYDMMEKHNFKQLRLVEWVKSNPQPLNSKTNYLSNGREFAVLGIKKSKPTFHSSYDQGIYHHPTMSDRNLTWHPTKKPVKMFEELIEKHGVTGRLSVAP